MKEIKDMSTEKYKGSTGCFKDGDGDIFYLLNEQFHRSDGPALDFLDGYKAWYYYGERANSEKQFYNPSWRRKIEIKEII